MTDTPVENPTVEDALNPKAPETETPKGEDKTNPLAEGDKPKAPDTVPHSVVGKLRQRVRELTGKVEAMAQTPEDVPDPSTHPAEYHAYMEQRAVEREQNARLNYSQQLAEEEYGVDAVEEALEALQTLNNPVVSAQIKAAASPWDAMVKWHVANKDLLLAQTDPVAFAAKIKQDVMDEIAGKKKPEDGKTPLGKTGPSTADLTSGKDGETPFVPPTLDAIFGDG